MRSPAVPHLGGEIRRTTLPSGLRVVSEAVPTSETFSLGFYVGTGSRHERGPLHGAAHFLEHVLFKGTRRRTAEEISLAVESVGGDLNAYTGKEHTCFYARVLGADADLAVDVISDMLDDSVISPADVEAERAVIIDEIAMHTDDPSDVAHDLIGARLFGADGLGLSVIGTTASIGALTQPQVQGYFHDHYRASAIVVSAAGHVDHDHLVAALTDFGTRERGATAPEPAVAPVVPTEDVGRLLESPRALEQVTAVLAVRGVGLFDPRRPALALLSVILGGGMSSRLFVQVRERRGLAYGIDAGETCYTDDGLWSVEWQSHPDRVLEILELIRGEVTDLAEHGVAPAELARAKGQLRGQTLLGYEGASSRMSRLGTAELTGDRRSVAQMLELTEQVSAEQCQAVAAEILTGPPVLALVGPRLPARTRRRIERWLG